MKTEYDYARLIGRMKELGYNQETFAKALGISSCSLNLRLNNKRSFRQDEIVKGGEILKIHPDELHCYFFTHKL